MVVDCCLNRLSGLIVDCLGFLKMQKEANKDDGRNVNIRRYSRSTLQARPNLELLTAVFTRHSTRVAPPFEEVAAAAVQHEGGDQQCLAYLNVHFFFANDNRRYGTGTSQTMDRQFA